MPQKQQGVIVRGFDGATGFIGAVRLPIPSGLVKRRNTDHVLIVTVSEATGAGQVIVTPVGMGNYHIQANQADVVEMEEEGAVV